MKKNIINGQVSYRLYCLFEKYKKNGLNEKQKQEYMKLITKYSDSIRFKETLEELKSVDFYNENITINDDIIYKCEELNNEFIFGELIYSENNECLGLCVNSLSLNYPYEDKDIENAFNQKPATILQKKKEPSVQLEQFGYRHVYTKEDGSVEQILIKKNDKPFWKTINFDDYSIIEA